MKSCLPSPRGLSLTPSSDLIDLSWLWCEMSLDFHLWLSRKYPECEGEPNESPCLFRGLSRGMRYDGDASHHVPHLCLRTSSNNSMKINILANIATIDIVIRLVIPSRAHGSHPPDRAAASA